MIAIKGRRDDANFARGAVKINKGAANFAGVRNCIKMGSLTHIE